MNRHPLEPPPPPMRKKRRGRFGWWMLFSHLLLALLAIYVVLALTQKAIPLPRFLADQASETISKSLAPTNVRVGNVNLRIGRNALPQITLQNVVLATEDGLDRAQIDEMSASLSFEALIEGDFAPSIIRIDGANLRIERDAEGNLAANFRQEGDALTPSVPRQQLLQEVDEVLNRPALMHLREISLTDVSAELVDLASGHIWSAEQGALDVEIDRDEIELSFMAEFSNDQGDQARLQARSETRRRLRDTTLTVSIVGLPARDLAVQTPALSFLGALEADLSGDLRVELKETGELTSLSAQLEHGPGRLHSGAGASLNLNQGRSYLTYDAAAQKLEFSEILFDGEKVNFTGSGYAYLTDFEGRWPTRIDGQLELDGAKFDLTDIFEAPVSFTGGSADLSVLISPLEITLGSATLIQNEDGVSTYFHADGEVGSTEDGWTIAMNFSSPELSSKHVLALWPKDAVAQTRVWLTDNVLDGNITNMRGALRIKPEAKPVLSAAFDFDDAKVRFLPHFPPIENGVGRGVFENDGFFIYLDEGDVRAAEGGVIDLSGSTFSVPKIVPKTPDLAKIYLHTEGSLTSALSILNNKPFEILEKSGIPATIASGHAVSDSNFELLLKKVVTKDDVDFTTTGVLSDVSSDSLLNGREFSAQRLDLKVDPQQLDVFGKIDFGGIAIDGEWRRPLNVSGSNQGELTGRLAITGDNLSQAGFSLPAGALTGETSAEFTLNLEDMAAAGFEISSDLQGLGISIPEIGWRKPQSDVGSLTIQGQITPQFSVSSLDLSATGLSVSAQPEISASGTLTRLSLPSLSISPWFRGSGVLRPQGQSFDLSILSGVLDLRRAPELGSGGANAPGRAPLSVALDELILSDRVALRPFNLSLPGGGQSGRMDGLVNGVIRVDGDLVPQQDGMALVLSARDGGGLLNQVGILPGASGGEMQISLLPLPGPGNYQGQLDLKNTVMRDVPSSAQFLNNLTIVGLLEQLEGQGIYFDDVAARFSVSPDLVRISRGSAVGPALGISVEGTYQTKSENLNLTGVVSPLYMINGIGSIFTKRGEGLFGMNYSVTGSAESPRFSVNPLSILTPGGFREIFRRPAPTPSQ